jgi:hypothetical protein
MASRALPERLKPSPACPVCDNERTVPRRPNSTVFTCCEQPWSLVAERVLLELREGEETYRWLTA